WDGVCRASEMLPPLWGGNNRILKPAAGPASRRGLLFSCDCRGMKVGQRISLRGGWYVRFVQVLGSSNCSARRDGECNVGARSDTAVGHSARQKADNRGYAKGSAQTGACCARS